MRSRTLLLIAAALITCIIVTIAQATPIVGLLVGTILSQGTINDETMIHVRVPLPPGTPGTDGDGDRAVFMDEHGQVVDRVTREQS